MKTYECINTNIDNLLHIKLDDINQKVHYIRNDIFVSTE